MSYVTIDFCQLENYFTIRGNIIMILNKNNNNNNNKGVLLVAAKNHKNDPNDWINCLLKQGEVFSLIQFDANSAHLKT